MENIFHPQILRFLSFANNLRQTVIDVDTVFFVFVDDVVGGDVVVVVNVVVVVIIVVVVHF